MKILGFLIFFKTLIILTVLGVFSMLFIFLTVFAVFNIVVIFLGEVPNLSFFHIDFDKLFNRYVTFYKIKETNSLLKLCLNKETFFRKENTKK